MKNKLLSILLFLSLILSFSPLIANQGFNITDVNKLEVNFTIDNTYSLAQSPIEQIVQIEPFGTNSLPNVIVSSKYQVFGVNSFILLRKTIP
ncbi:MAG: hypothetical protein ACXAC2_13865 [Candidatus Kariarchaeaceae archaeon]|jgi:hypothetical protein